MIAGINLIFIDRDNDMLTVKCKNVNCEISSPMPIVTSASL